MIPPQKTLDVIKQADRNQRESIILKTFKTTVHQIQKIHIPNKTNESLKRMKKLSSKARLIGPSRTHQSKEEQNEKEYNCCILSSLFDNNMLFIKGFSTNCPQSFYKVGIIISTLQVKRQGSKTLYNGTISNRSIS